MELKAYKTRSIQGFNTDGTLDRARLDLLCSPHRPEYFLSSSPPRVDSGYNSPTPSPTAAEAPATTTTMSLPLIRRALPKRGRKPHVCIVGAGVSGLRCADILLQAGLRVTVLEARNRVGGRVSSLAAFVCVHMSMSSDHLGLVALPGEDAGRANGRSVGVLSCALVFFSCLFSSSASKDRGKGQGLGTSTLLISCERVPTFVSARIP